MVPVQDFAGTEYGAGLSGRTDLPHSAGDRSGGAFPSHQLAGQKHLRAVWRWSRGCGAGSRSVGGVRSGRSFHWKWRRRAYLCQQKSAGICRRKNADLTPTYMQMDGKEVFKFAVSKVPEVIRRSLSRQEKQRKKSVIICFIRLTLKNCFICGKAHESI